MTHIRYEVLMLVIFILIKGNITCTHNKNMTKNICNVMTIATGRVAIF